MKSRRRYSTSSESEHSAESAESSEVSAESAESDSESDDHRRRKRRAATSESESDEEESRKKAKKRKHKKKKKKHGKKRRRDQSASEEQASSESETERKRKHKHKHSHKSKRDRSSSPSVQEVPLRDDHTEERSRARLLSVVKERRHSSVSSRHQSRSHRSRSHRSRSQRSRSHRSRSHRSRSHRSASPPERHHRYYQQKEYARSGSASEGYEEHRRVEEVERFYRGSSKDRSQRGRSAHDDHHKDQRYEGGDRYRDRYGGNDYNNGRHEEYHQSKFNQPRRPRDYDQYNERPSKYEDRGGRYHEEYSRDDQHFRSHGQRSYNPRFQHDNRGEKKIFTAKPVCLICNETHMGQSCRRNFRPRPREYPGDDRDYKSGERDYKGGDRDFKRGDRDFKRGDRDFKRDDRGYKGGDRDYKEGERQYRDDRHEKRPGPDKRERERERPEREERARGSREHRERSHSAADRKSSRDSVPHADRKSSRDSVPRVDRSRGRSEDVRPAVKRERPRSQERDGPPPRKDRKSRFNEEEGKDFSWGKEEVKKETAPVDKDKPNFGLSGKLAEDTNTVNGIVLKYSEPPDAKQPKRRWRFYPFKGDKALPILYIHRQSSFVLGRDHKAVDIPLEHPSVSKQHAALQYRATPFTRPDGTQARRVRPYIIDLDSANGTFVNNKKIEPRRFVELLERDVVKFGFSQREYVLLHENSKDDAADDDQEMNGEMGAAVTSIATVKREKQMKQEATEDG